MNKWVKGTSLALVILAVAGVATVIVGKEMGERKMQRVIKVDLAPFAMPAKGAYLEQGRYLFATRGCADCHGTTFSGGRIPGTPPEWPTPANLTPGVGSAMMHYNTPDAFVTMLRTGKRPDGSPISAVMPFGSLSQMSDVDMRALHSYLQTLPRARRVGGKSQALLRRVAPCDATFAIDHGADDISHPPRTVTSP